MWFLHLHFCFASCRSVVTCSAQDHLLNRAVASLACCMGEGRPNPPKRPLPLPPVNSSSHENFLPVQNSRVRGTSGCVSCRFRVSRAGLESPPSEFCERLRVFPMPQLMIYIQAKPTWFPKLQNAKLIFFEE